jgi:hypothetical protein
VGQFEISPANLRQPRYISGMTGKTPKRPRDANQLAKLMVDIATGEEASEELTPAQEKASKGGQKGGRARARALSPAERSEIASIAAQARWKKTS